MINLQVVELEISLDETREQYNNVLRTSNNRAQQKKMAFLERNLEQLTVVQRQLVEQNNSLKKDVAIAERKLIARNERIQSLESLLQDSQEKLTQANHRLATTFHTPPLSLSEEEEEEEDWVIVHTNYSTSKNSETILSFPCAGDWEVVPSENWEIVPSPPQKHKRKQKANNTSQPRFEVQLTAVKERLEAAKAGSTRGLADSMSGQSFAFSGGSRIAKPLRGGGGGEQLPVAGVPTINSLKDMDVQGGGAGKRGSWFSNMRV